MIRREPSSLFLCRFVQQSGTDPERRHEEGKEQAVDEDAVHKKSAERGEETEAVAGFSQVPGFFCEQAVERQER